MHCVGGNDHQSDMCEFPPAFALLILKDLFMTYGGKLVVDLLLWIFQLQGQESRIESDPVSQ